MCGCDDALLRYRVAMPLCGRDGNVDVGFASDIDSVSVLHVAGDVSSVGVVVGDDDDVVGVDVVVCGVIDVDVTGVFVVDVVGMGVGVDVAADYDGVVVAAIVYDGVAVGGGVVVLYAGCC